MTNLVDVGDVIKLIEGPDMRDKLVALLMESYDRGVADTKEVAIQAVSEAVAAEREACAMVAEEMERIRFDSVGDPRIRVFESQIAKAIRARGEK